MQRYSFLKVNVTIWQLKLANDWLKPKGRL